MKISRRVPKEKLINAIENSGGVIATIAKRLGVSWSTAERHIQKYGQSRDAYHDENMKLLDMADVGLYQRVKDGDLQAIMWLQRTKGKYRGYTEKQEIEVNNDSAITINVVRKPKEIAEYAQS